MAKVTASMAGTVFQVLVEVGAPVQPDEDVVILESMKMEVPVTTDQGGRISAVHVQPGDFVNEGDTLVEVEEA